MIEGFWTLLMCGIDLEFTKSQCCCPAPLPRYGLRMVTLFAEESWSPRGQPTISRNQESTESIWKCSWIISFSETCPSSNHLRSSKIGAKNPLILHWTTMSKCPAESRKISHASREISLDILPRIIPYQLNIGGVLKSGFTPINSVFISWKIPTRNGR